MNELLVLRGPRGALKADIDKKMSDIANALDARSSGRRLVFLEEDWSLCVLSASESTTVSRQLFATGKDISASDGPGIGPSVPPPPPPPPNG